MLCGVYLIGRYIDSIHYLPFYLRQSTYMYIYSAAFSLHKLCNGWVKLRKWNTHVLLLFKIQFHVNIPVWYLLKKKKWFFFQKGEVTTRYCIISASKRKNNPPFHEVYKASNNCDMAAWYMWWIARGMLSSATSGVGVIYRPPYIPAIYDLKLNYCLENFSLKT